MTFELKYLHKEKLVDCDLDEWFREETKLIVPTDSGIGVLNLSQSKSTIASIQTMMDHFKDVVPEKDLLESRNVYTESTHCHLRQ